MKEENYGDINDGALYMRVQKKMPETLLARYHRWIGSSGKKESLEQLKDWVIQESQYLTIASETIHGLRSENEKKYSPKSSARTRSYYANPQIEKKKKICGVCDNEHETHQCEKFKAMDVPSRWAMAKEKRLCFRCLRNNHRGNECRLYRKCNIDGCVKTHDKLLHSNNDQSKQGFSLNVNAQEFTSGTNTDEQAFTSRQANSKIALRTVPVIISTEMRTLKINALLDDGSSKTYINEDVAYELGLDGESETVKVNLLNGRTESFSTKTVAFCIESENRQLKMNIEANTTKNVTGSLKAVNWNEHCGSWDHLKGIPFPNITKKSKVDLLIGINYSDLHSTLDETIKQFWEIEHVKVDKPELSQEENVALGKAKDTIEYTEKMYEIGIPWKENNVELPNNYDMALTRLQNTERRLDKNPTVSKAYSEIIKSYEEKGYITKITESVPQNSQSWYLPHFPVIRPEKETTKVRIVFDASAKYQNVCLNDVVYAGPKLQNELFDVLLRFRKKPVAIVCDIAEMYLRVGILETDRRFHRFLWNSKCDPPEQYEFNRLVFGVNASPFLAQFVAQENAKAFKEQFPRASESVMKSTYMDDTMDCVGNEAMNLYHELPELWKLAGMNPRKWMTNSTAVLAEIPQDERAYKAEVKANSELPAIKTLGLSWDSQEDVFSLRSLCAQKMIMQDIWVTGVDWDDELPEELSEEIKKWFSELEQLNELQVPRCLDIRIDSTLHTFVDASTKAYGAVVYSVNGGDSGQTVNLIASKSRVAPLKSISIPRLELLAASLGLQLTQAICNVLDMPVENVVFWSDSMNVLYWIHGASRQYKTFVANRVGSIHEITSPSQWRHVPTVNNPADLTSRGSLILELSDCSFWWHGPEFLKYAEEHWPENKFEMTEEVKIEMKRKSETDKKYNFVITTKEEDRLNPTNYSDWNHLVRISAWINRFIDNCQMSKRDRRLSKELCLSEIDEAEKRLIRIAQIECFEQEYTCISKGKAIPNSSKLAPLNPILDTDGLLRCNSRLKYADYISYDVRYPIILPRKHSITKLIVKQNHEHVNHGGTNQTLSSLSSRFWIISAREEIRQWENICAECRRRKAKASKQIMAPLPVERLSHSVRAFANTGVDYAGPFITKQGRGKVRLKRYLCVFTCLVTRAVHLEISYNMDTNSFLNTLYRFISRRGVPDTIVSDNGSNFVGCVNELRELYRQLDEDAIIHYANEKRINWKFLPPNAPHFGGAHESMVKCAKRALFAILKNGDITDEDLITAVVGAEGLINSRPLTYQSSNPKDNTVLTPNHFLYGQAGGNFAPDINNVTSRDLQRRWRFVQELLRHFWKRWLQEYLPTLGVRNKWFLGTRDFTVGDIVMVIDPDVPRGQWHLGRITKVFPGRDGHVRVAEVHIGNNILKRPITRLALLQGNEQ
ncbi:uncharacterized protein LOC123558187 [Mercenaria mercenaria]|uniref:uncharacterized protein LOC123558187 n=1 Tax=Mercenaria mercenaria TaxID=6596 RepID=UPI00234EF8E1|nr:uncharacterized protein LOC123558187 [Mercenaria mercenaria]